MKEQPLQGRYQILKSLGNGKHAQTYLAEDLQSEPKLLCVIKQVEPKSRDTLSLRKAKYLFAREIKILKVLGRSDRIPNVMDNFFWREKFYLVHQYIKGSDLNAELGDRQWSEFEVWQLLKEILEIVEIAHREKVSHQDIKPSNILRRQCDGHLMLLDFGSIKQINSQIANAYGQTSQITPTGSAGYMAPEQKSLNPKLASDIYAVGMIAIYALTGVTPTSIPVDYETDAVQWQNLVQVDSKLAKVLTRMVSPNFSQRYKSATEALIAVRNLSLGGNLLNFKTALGTGALILVLGMGGYYYWQLENSLSKTSELEMFERDRTQFPFLYRHAASGLEIKYPANWKITKSAIDQGTIAQFHPQQQEGLLSIPEVNIEVNSHLTLESFEKLTTDTVYSITQLPQTRIIDSRPVTISGEEGHQVVYTRFNSEQNLDKKYLQVWTVNDQWIYTITYHASIDDYQSFVKMVEQEMLPSIKISFSRDS